MFSECGSWEENSVFNIIEEGKRVDGLVTACVKVIKFSMNRNREIIHGKNEISKPFGLEDA